eukprot:CAMPEP_0205822854 /NCGR_PEP_ID=MMETSP0206-20130828/14309_1 /ASSEMBLY_ACC=CAM_ASM_000279 /TAXON_ID=36767 /ORGANISM="Euplotes focardii, Strain TN1" /LENGTH=299 /DNA_ID=CAMNT_0053119481 /DNA_START=38 /DNA_END=937 /DNA_ORIENTATION=+
MAAELRYDGKVALVTGSGAGLGRIYAKLLASRGAKVVVNDLGKNKETGEYAADIVVAEIKAAGGEAVANYNSVVDGAKVVQTALDTWGRIDIVVNNAGILRDVTFHRMKQEQWDIVLAVHLMATRNICAAAWPSMRANGYGRVVNITSVNGLYGQVGQTNYSAAKAGIMGFSKALAKEGSRKNIKVNIVAPGAGSAMTATIMPPAMVEAWKPEYVAPMVALLCHEDAPCTGKIFEAGGGWFAEVKWTRSAGEYFDLDTPYGPEDVLAKFAAITDFSKSDFPEEELPGQSPQLKQILAKL